MSSSLAPLSSVWHGKKSQRLTRSKGATLSTRYSTGEKEPKYLSEMKPDTNASNKNGIFSADAHYRNIPSWMQDRIDMNSTKQPFIFALGPKLHDHVDGSPTAMIQRHVVYGRFTMDMTKAVSSSAPEANGENGTWISNSASSAFGVSSDFDAGSAIHAVVMCLAFVIIFPLGALLLRIVSVRVHYMVQLAASILVIVGIGSGIYISMEYNRVSADSKLLYLNTNISNFEKDAELYDRSSNYRSDCVRRSGHTIAPWHNSPHHIQTHTQID